MIQELFKRDNKYYIVVIHSPSTGWNVAFNNVKNMIDYISDGIQINGCNYCSLCQVGGLQNTICRDCYNMVKYLKGARQDRFTHVSCNVNFYIIRDHIVDIIYVIDSSDNKLASLKIVATYDSLRQALITADFADKEALIARLTRCYWFARQTALIGDIIDVIINALLQII